MKKNEAMGYLAYALMLAIALLVGLVFVKPIFDNSAYYQALPMNSMLFILLAVIAGILLNALFIEIGHAIGAKIGHYQIVSWICLGVGVKQNKDGKKELSFSNFDGITGETKVVPLDVKKSNPRQMIYLPMVFFLVEVIALSVFIGFARASVATLGPVMMGWSAFAIAIMAVGGMIYVYNIFPAALDAKNDGYLLTILTNDTNKIAYNQMLLAQDRMARGLPAEQTPVYDSVTDFTAKINDVTLYQRLEKKDYSGAIEILDKTIASKDKVSGSVYNDAIAQKISIEILTQDLAVSKERYIALPLDEKKYIASLVTAPCVRSYLLISGLIEESYAEAKEALNHVDAAIKKSGVEKKEIELAILRDSLSKVAAVHSDWDFSEFESVLGVHDAANKDKKEDGEKQ